MRRALVAEMLFGSASIAYAGPGKTDFAAIVETDNGVICWNLIDISIMTN